MTLASIETKAIDFLHVVEKDAVIAWDKFQEGLIFLGHEASIIANALQGSDPAVAAQWQTFILNAEASAKELLDRSQGGMSNLIATGVDQAEQSAANLIQKATGNKPDAATSALMTSGIQFLGTTLEHMTTVGFAKAFAALMAASAAANQKAMTPPSASTSSVSLSGDSH